MTNTPFPVIDPVATGENILRLRQERGLSVRDLQAYFGFEEPQAIYKWQRGKSLPTVDNLYALGALLDVPIEQQARACCSPHFMDASYRFRRIRQKAKIVLNIWYHALQTMSLNCWFKCIVCNG